MMTERFIYPFWARIYSAWWFLGLSLLLFIANQLWIKSESFLVGYLIIMCLMAIQYYFTEYHATYDPISISSSGLSFHTKDADIIVSWESLKNIRSFPTASFQPAQWSQAMLSSGILITTVEEQEFVIYSKLNNYKKALYEITKNT
jgi:hypothetical protein